LGLWVEGRSELMKISMPKTKKELASFIDHTLLKPEATKKDIRRICQEAKKFGFAAVCVHPYRVKLCANVLKGTPVEICTVIGFPFGTNGEKSKAYEAKVACQDGAEEIDMVLNVGAMKDKDYVNVKKDIRGVVRAVKGENKKNIVKVILETCYLTKAEIARACKIVQAAGADFVKTSTGLGPRGASIEDIKIMRKSCNLKIKAAGGIRTAKEALAMIRVGAIRIGCSKSIDVISGKRVRKASKDY